MFGWFRRKPPPPPVKQANATPSVVVRAAGHAGRSGRRSPSYEDVMAAAVHQAAADGFSTRNAAKITEYMQNARTELKRARASADFTGAGVLLRIGDKQWNIIPNG